MENDAARLPRVEPANPFQRPSEQNDPCLGHDVEGKHGILPSRPRIRFGSHSDFGAFAAEYLDTERFTAEYGSLEDADLEGYDCIVPFNFADYRLLEQRRPDLRGKKYLSPRPDTVALCDDKYLFNQWMIDNGFEGMIPELYDPDRRKYPYIIKKKIDENGFSAHIIKSEDEEFPFLEYIFSPEYILQSYAGGSVEFSMHGLMANGKLYYHQMVEFKMFREFFTRGRGDKDFGFEVDYRVNDDDMYRFLPILEQLDFEGAFCIDYKVHDGCISIFEVNPRIGISMLRDVNRYLDAYLDGLAAGPAAQMG